MRERETSMKRILFALYAAAIFSLSLVPASVFAAGGTGVSAEDAIQMLKDGNARYVAEIGKTADLGDERRKELAKGQHPFAIIVSCSDSRVPPEHIFDQGLGDLFVIRVAGNVVEPVELGSVEYAAEHLGTKLIVVLGHEKCGAVKAAIDTGGHAPGNIGAIVKNIAPAVKSVKRTSSATGDAFVDACVKANAHKTAADLVNKSRVLAHMVEEHKIKIVVAEYMLGTGEVEFLHKEE